MVYKNVNQSVALMAYMLLSLALRTTHQVHESGSYNWNTLFRSKFSKHWMFTEEILLQLLLKYIQYTCVNIIEFRIVHPWSTVKRSLPLAPHCCVLGKAASWSPSGLSSAVNKKERLETVETTYAYYHTTIQKHYKNSTKTAQCC